MRFCVRCQKYHRFDSWPWKMCFGIVPNKSNYEFFLTDRVAKSFTGIGLKGMSLTDLQKECMEFLGQGISVRHNHD